MQIELKIVVFNPVRPDQFMGDVYLNGTRVFCGTGIYSSALNAMHGTITLMSQAGDLHRSITQEMEAIESKRLGV